MSDSESVPRKKVIVAILDWGLGHATRMVPLIRELQESGRDVVLASSGAALSLLGKEFPTLPAEELPAYNVRYSRSAAGLPWIIVRQLPRLLKLVRKEQEVMSRLAEKHRASVIISDNRYGARVAGLRNIFITHQLFIRTPYWLKPAEWMTRLINHRIISRFDECWVPDFSGKVNLSGELSHQRRMPGHVRFIGPLSRFKPIETDPEETFLPIDLLIILSGPEPQRTHLEEKLLSQAGATRLNTVLVRGVERPTPAGIEDNLRLINVAGSEELFDLIRQSRLIICRSGYSSIMDLAVTGKDAILIPTPGQTEQEYLASRFRKDCVFYSEKQSSFDLQRAMEASQEFSGLKLQLNESLLVKALQTL